MIPPSLIARRRAHCAFCAMVLLMLVAVPRRVAAQEPVEPVVPVEAPPLAAGPPGGVPPVKPTIVPTRLDLGVSLFEAYDLTTVTDGLPGLVADPRLEQNSSFTGADVSLSYAKAGQDRSINAVAGSDFRYYSIEPTVLPMNYFGGISGSTTVRRRLVLQGRTNLSYSPYYSFGNTLAPSTATQIVLPEADNNVALLKTYTSDSSGSMLWTINKKASFVTSYTFDYVYTPESLYRVSNQGANAAFQYRTTRYLSLRFGYGFSRSSLGSTTLPSFDAHDIDVGLSYRRPLSFSRHTVVGFNVGSTVLSALGTYQFFVTGDASLTHQLTRRWTATASYSRSVGRVGVVAQPFVTDSIGGGLGGQWTRHVTFNATGGFTHGGAALGVQNAYVAANGSGRITARISQYLPVYVEYVYYYYRFDQSVGLVPGFPLLVDRHGLRTGLSYSLPLIGQRATRR